jgi:hypothetical protein
MSASDHPNARRGAALTSDDDLIYRGCVIFDNAEPLRGSFGELYLAGLGLEVPDAALRVLRFHPACRFGGSFGPCLAAYVQDFLTNEPRGVHLIPISTYNAEIAPKTIGCIDRYVVIKLGGGNIASADLTIAASVETALAAMAHGFSPAWSVLSVEGIADFLKPRFHGIKRLTVIVDSDDTIEAAVRCKARWGNIVRLVAAPEVSHLTRKHSLPSLGGL